MHCQDVLATSCEACLALVYNLVACCWCSSLDLLDILFLYRFSLVTLLHVIVIVTFLGYIHFHL